MVIYVSTLIMGTECLEDIALWVRSLQDPDIGVEIIAFTHDEAYFARLESLLPLLSCPISFHGPYIGTEATSPLGSERQAFLLNSYERVLRLAAQHSVRHVVYHTTQMGFPPEELQDAQANSRHNTQVLMEMADNFGVQLLVENLAYPPKRAPLFTNEEYDALFTGYSRMKSIIDIGHAHINKMDVEGFLKRYHDRVECFHLHNNDGEIDRHNDIYHGTYPMEKFGRLYRTYTPSAGIVLEYEPHVNLSPQEILQHVLAVRQLCGA